jgi:DNA-binding NtrC family response regulator
VLEKGEVLRVGSSEPVPVDVRVLAASNQPMDQALAEGKLREDLFYRLNVFPIALPPLRDRSGDAALLAQEFLVRLNRDEGVDKRWSSEALERIAALPWSGNVRELKNAVQRAWILAEDVIPGDSLPTPGEPGAGVGQGPLLHVRLGSSIADAERRLIQATLEHCEEDKKRAAEILGISLKTLYNRLNAYRGA